MLVPEATVNKDYLPESRKNQIRNAGKLANVKAISEPHAVHHTAHNHLRAGVHTLYAGHPFATLLFGEIVHWGRMILIRILHLTISRRALSSSTALILERKIAVQTSFFFERESFAERLESK